MGRTRRSCAKSTSRGRRVHCAADINLKFAMCCPHGKRHWIRYESLPANCCQQAPNASLRLAQPHILRTGGPRLKGILFVEANPKLWAGLLTHAHTRLVTSYRIDADGRGRGLDGRDSMPNQGEGRPQAWRSPRAGGSKSCRCARHVKSPLRPCSARTRKTSRALLSLARRRTTRTCKTERRADAADAGQARKFSEDLALPPKPLSDESNGELEVLNAGLIHARPAH